MAFYTQFICLHLLKRVHLFLSHVNFVLTLLYSLTVCLWVCECECVSHLSSYSLDAGTKEREKEKKYCKHKYTLNCKVCTQSDERNLVNTAREVKCLPGDTQLRNETSQVMQMRARVCYIRRRNMNK